MNRVLMIREERGLQAEFGARIPAITIRPLRIYPLHPDVMIAES